VIEDAAGRFAVPEPWWAARLASQRPTGAVATRAKSGGRT
jgi:hypothetical protein